MNASTKGPSLSDAKTDQRVHRYRVRVGVTSFSPKKRTYVDNHDQSQSLYRSRFGTDVIQCRYHFLQFLQLGMVPVRIGPQLGNMKPQVA